jgi:2-polyprenyl-3-methyl-5-hydroxy-6-metoxy-1,4-benzoquinol methylase
MLERVRELYYRRFTHLNLRRHEEVETLLAWLGARPGERILDIGCGDGFFTHRMASAGADVVGVDLDDARLAIAARRNTSAGTTYHHMDAQEIDFPDGSFDKAVSLCVIEHFDDDDRVIGQVARLLKPGGLFVLSADSLTNPEITEDEMREHRHRYAVNTFYTVNIMRQKVERVGLELVSAHYILTTPLSLRLARMGWRLDRLPPRLAALGEVGYAVLNTVGKKVMDLSERRARRADSGLTLLARVCKH